ncbi:MAG: thiamine-phosphate kinase [Armatimonadota bacterium]
MPHETVGDVGEFGLLARLRERLASPYVGDDAAVLPIPPGRHLLATVDAQVDGVHFLREVMTPQQIGHRAIAVNVSDIAAMGGTPRYALLSLLLPASIETSWVEAVYDGVRDEAARWEMVVAGGNISQSGGHLVIDVTVLGDVDPALVLRRQGARAGDALLVTGDLGRAAAGLRLLRGGEVATRGRVPGGSEQLVAAYCTPTPRVREGQALAQTRAVHAAMDLSDGLASDLQRLAEESGVGACIDAAALPISSDVRVAAADLGLDPLDLALRGGEDFELLVAAPPGALSRLTAAVGAVGTRLSRIGEVRPAADGVTVRLADGTVSSLAGGWDHFVGRREVR